MVKEYNMVLPYFVMGDNNGDLLRFVCGELGVHPLSLITPWNSTYHTFVQLLWVASDRNWTQTTLGRVKKLLEEFQSKRCLDQTMGKADTAGLQWSKVCQNIPPGLPSLLTDFSHRTRNRVATEQTKQCSP